MFNFLSAFFGFFSKLFTAWHDAKKKEEGRQEAIRDVNDEIQQQIDLGEAAASVPDDARTAILRARFDRAQARASAKE